MSPLSSSIYSIWNMFRDCQSIVISLNGHTMLWVKTWDDACYQCIWQWDRSTRPLHWLRDSLKQQEWRESALCKKSVTACARLGLPHYAFAPTYLGFTDHCRGISRHVWLAWIKFTECIWSLYQYFKRGGGFVIFNSRPKGLLVVACQGEVSCVERTEEASL